MFNGYSNYLFRQIFLRAVSLIKLNHNNKLII